MVYHIKYDFNWSSGIVSKKVTPKWVLLCIPTAAPKKPIKTISNNEACSTHVGVAFRTYLPYTNQLNMTVIVTSAKPVSTSQI